MSAWNEIGSAPRDGTDVLLYGICDGEISGPRAAAERVVGSFRYGEWGVSATDTYGVRCHATHWMPLPSPPVAGGGT